MRALLFIVLLSSASVSAATDWQMRPGSTLGFSASYQGESFAGRFSRFTPHIRFDPAHPADGRFDVDIDLTSADTENSERDELLQGSDFFDTGKLPHARFVATRFRALGDNRYAADGTLSLRGIAHPVTLSFTWTAGATAVLDGHATLHRLAFGVGGGDWTDTELIPDEVTVKTRLMLAPLSPAAAANVGK